MTVLTTHDSLKVAGETDARWRVLDPVVRDGMIKLYDRRSKTEHYQDFGEINAKIVSNEIVVVRKDAPLISVATQADPQLQARIAGALEALQVVKTIQSQYRISFSAAYEEAIGSRRSPALCSSSLPSKQTLYRYRAAARSGYSILRGDKNKGNRTPRYSPEVVSLVLSRVQQLYLVPKSVWTIAKLTAHINAEAHSLGLLPSSSRISQEYVRKVMRDSGAVDPEGERMDPKQRPAARSIGGRRIIIERPLERVEMDTVHLPVKVMLGDHIADNIHLTQAIDCCTSVVLGWRFTVGPPSESDGLRCVESILFSKRDTFKRLGLDEQIDLDVCGTPEVLVVDNGPENKGERMTRLAGLGITLEYCKSKHPHHKPFIERLNKSFKAEVLDLLPGTTRFNGKDGARDPVQLGESLLTLEELERWIVRWYYQSWVKHELERLVRKDFEERVKLGRTPEQRWISIQESGYPARPSPSVTQWELTRRVHHERQLNRKSGISFEGFRYKGPNLAKLISRFGETNVKILVDLDDFREVLVYTAEGEPLVPLTEEFVTTGSPAYSFADMKRRSAELRPQPIADPVAKKFNEDLRQARLTSPARPARLSRTDRNRAASSFARETEAVDRTNHNTPLKAEPKNTFVNIDKTASFALGPIPELRVVNRATGEAAE